MMNLQPSNLTLPARSTPDLFSPVSAWPSCSIWLRRLRGLAVFASATMALMLAAADNAVPAADPAPPAARRTFTWKDLSQPEYAGYLAALRAAGCPENRLRDIVLGDINELFDQKRLQDAIESDITWWKPATTFRPTATIAAIAAEQERRENLRAELLAQYLGKGQTNGLKPPPLVSGVPYNLTGPVLGAIPSEKFFRVVELCKDLPLRLRAYQLACNAEGKAADPIEEAKIRETTRTQLAQILTPEEMEEYQVRNSNNALALRTKLRAFNPTPEEFKKILTVTDPLQWRMQLEYGHERNLSTRQREEYRKGCDQAVEEVLEPGRFKTYLLTNDPSYVQAHSVATARQFDEKATLRLYEAYRDQAARREKLTADTSLTPAQRSQSLLALSQEIQRLLNELTAEKNAGKNGQ